MAVKQAEVFLSALCKTMFAGSLLGFVKTAHGTPAPLCRCFNFIRQHRVFAGGQREIG